MTVLIEESDKLRLLSLRQLCPSNVLSCGESNLASVKAGAYCNVHNFECCDKSATVWFFDKE